MKNKVFFGPAGSPVNYKGAAYKAPKYIQRIGLDSYEYQSPYGVRIGEKSAKILKEEAEKFGILISMHGPYYINLCAKDSEKIDKSIGHLIATARAGEWMGAYRLVFHPGFYTNQKPEKAMEISKQTINRLFEELEAEGIKDFTFAPETTGKRTQQGNIEEIVELCASFDHFEPTIDFAHIHAITVFSQLLKTNWILTVCTATSQLSSMQATARSNIIHWMKVMNMGHKLKIY